MKVIKFLLRLNLKQWLCLISIIIRFSISCPIYILGKLLLALSHFIMCNFSEGIYYLKKVIKKDMKNKKEENFIVESSIVAAIVIGGFIILLDLLGVPLWVLLL